MPGKLDASKFRIKASERNAIREKTKSRGNVDIRIEETTDASTRKRKRGGTCYNSFSSTPLMYRMQCVCL
jgi:hypothetical protein